MARSPREFDDENKLKNDLYRITLFMKEHTHREINTEYFLWEQSANIKKDL